MATVQKKPRKLPKLPGKETEDDQRDQGRGRGRGRGAAGGGADVIPPGKKRELPPLKKGRGRDRDTRSMMDMGRQSPPEVTQRTSLTATNNAKTCFFYIDNDYTFPPLKMVIHPKKHKRLETVSRDLSVRMKNLPFGVRSIYTPRGQHRVHNLEDLTQDGQYVCSSNRKFARGMDVARVVSKQVWHHQRPDSGRKNLNNLLKDFEIRSAKHRAGFRPGYDLSNVYSRLPPKKTTVMKNGEPDVKHTLLLNRRTAQTFEQVLTTLSDLFQFAVMKLFTIDGTVVDGLQKMLQGPEVLVAVGKEPFINLNMDYHQQRRNRSRMSTNMGSRVSIHTRMQNRRSRLSNTKGRWVVTTRTNALPSAGTQAQVTINVYGNKGNSGAVTLGNGDGSQFGPGAVDHFEILVGNVGEIYKIRLAHDNSGDFPGWLCDEVAMRDQDTGEELLFSCRRWLARDEDDQEITRELALDSFEVEAVSLGHLKRIIIGHDGTGPGNGWFLDKVIIREPPFRTNQENVFHCGKWLDEGEDDGKIVRELRAQDEYMDDILEKRHWEFEKWKYDKDCQVVLFSVMTGKALRLNRDLSVDGIGDERDKYVIMHGKGGPYCEFRVRVQQDRTTLFESVKNSLQFLTIGADGTPGEVRGILDKEPSRRFHVYAKGAFRHKGVIMFCTSMHQAVNVVQQDMTLTGKGKRGGPQAQFRVHKVNTGGIRMFESVAHPGKFVRLKDNKIDCNGGKSEDAHFLVLRHKDKGYITLQSAGQRGLFLGMTPEGRVHTTLDTGGIKKVQSTKEVEEQALMSVRKPLSPEPEPEPSPEPEPAPAIKQYAEKEQSVHEEITESISKESTLSEEQINEPKDAIEPNESIEPNETVEEPVEMEVEEVEDGDWSIHVSSLSELVDGDVALVAYGDKGNSGPIVLGAPPGRKIFQEGNEDEFRANLLKIGKMFKIRLELIAKISTRNPQWQVKEVRMQDLNTEETLKFGINRWLFREEDDGEVMREMAVQRPGESSLPLRHYVVTVTTGKEMGAETDAPVYITAHGEFGDWGKRYLLHSNNNMKFRTGQVDVFFVEAVSLGALQRCVIGHDGTGAGEGWYLEQVTIKEDEHSPDEFVFPCNRWLDTGMEDRHIERALMVKAGLHPALPIVEEEATKEAMLANETSEIQPISDDVPVGQGENDNKTEAEPEKEPEGDYQLEIITGPESDVDSTGKVHVMLYGENGKSDQIDLHALIPTQKVFEPGNIDKFTVPQGSFGEVYKIRIGRDDSEKWSRWFLNEVRMSEPGSETPLVFSFNRWLARDMDDGDMCRELPAIRVVVGDHWAASTDANMYITLHGSHGDSGKRLLHKSVSNRVKFQRGQTLEQLSLCHDGRGHGAGVFVEKVVVTERSEEKSHMRHVFPCGRWLDTHEDDCQTERMLRMIDVIDTKKQPSTKEKKKSSGSWTVTVKTSEGERTATTGKVLITVYGTSGHTEALLLSSPDPGTLAFTSGAESEFHISTGQVGRVTKIRLEHDNSGSQPDWRLDYVRMYDEDSSEELMFYADRWLALDKDDGSICRELPAVRKGTPSLPGRWHIQQVSVSEGVRSPTQHMFYCHQWLLPSDTHVTEFLLSEVCPSTNLVEAVESISRGLERPVHTKGRWLVLASTGTQPDAGTQGQVTLVLCGLMGESQPVCINSKEELKPGSIVKAEVKAADIGLIFKVRLSFQDRQLGSSWYFAKMKLKDQDTGEEFIVEHNDLIESTNENTEGVAEIALPRPDIAPLKDQIYIVSVKTGNVPRAETEADVFCNLIDGEWNIHVTTASAGHLPKLQGGEKAGEVSVVVYGTDGVRGPLELTHPDTDSPVVLLAPGKTDIYHNIELTGVGEIEKIRVSSGYEGDTEALWIIDKVVLEDVSSGEQLVFDFSQWVGQVGGDIRKEVPLVTRDKPTHRVIPYFVEVHTSEEEMNASTNANVFITLYGSHADSGRRHLIHSKSKQKRFQSGQVDQFEIEAVDLGDLEKIVVAKGPGKPWLLEKIVVKKGEFEAEEQIFMFGGWIGDKESQGSEVEETLKLTATIPSHVAIPIKDAPHLEPTGRWSIEVVTGGRRGPDGALDPVVVFCGQDGETPHLHLTPTSTDTFQIGLTDTFKVKYTEKVGELRKVRFGFADQSVNKAWYIRKVKFEDEDSGDVFWAEVNDWVAIDNKLDGCREVAVPWPAVIVQQVMEYKLSVHLGQVNPDSWENEVYVCLIGDQGSTGRRLLKHSETNTEKFRDRQVDVFLLEAVNIGDLVKLLIGHNNMEKGGGWFLERVVVHESVEDTEQVLFMCNKWLDAGEDDGQVERTLFPSDEPVTNGNQNNNTTPLPEEVREPSPAKVESPVPSPEAPAVEEEQPTSQPHGIKYNITMTTGGEVGLDDGQLITMVMYGDRGHSSPKVMGNDQEHNFKPGSTDTFDVYVEEDIGDMYKVRLGFHEEETHPNWYTDIKNSPTWFLEKYEVSVYTSEQSKPNIEANMYLQIFGECGDTGFRKFMASKTHTNKFEPGNRDVFEVGAVDLGKLTQLKLRHDGSGPGSGWQLDKVVVRETEETTIRYVFKYDRYVDEGGVDMGVEQTLALSQILVSDEEKDDKPAEQQAEQQVEQPAGYHWIVETVTEDYSTAETSQPVEMVVYQSDGQHQTFVIGDADDFKFKPGATDTFDIRLIEELGDLYKVRIGYHGVAMDTDWYKSPEQAPTWCLKQLKLQDKEHSRVYEVTQTTWLQMDEQTDFWREQPFPLPNGAMPFYDKRFDQMQKTVTTYQYHVELHTSTQSRAGTGARVFLSIHGNHGDTGFRRLMTAPSTGRTFEPGNCDIFEMSAVDLGDLSMVSLMHDGGVERSGWFLDKVIVRETGESTTKYVFSCDKWQDIEEGEKVVTMEIPLTEVVEDKEEKSLSGAPWSIWVVTGGDVAEELEFPVELVLYGDSGHSQPVIIGGSEGATFNKGQVDAFELKLKDETAGVEYEVEGSVSVQTEKHTDFWRELPVINTGKHFSVYKYEVCVHTQDGSAASEDSIVSVQLYGERGDSGPRRLMASKTHEHRFQTSQADMFEIPAVDLGKLTKVKVNQVGSRSGWLIEKVTVKESTESLSLFVFACGHGLEGVGGQGSEVILPLTEVVEIQPEQEKEVVEPKTYQVVDWLVRVVTSEEMDSGTDSNVILDPEAIGQIRKIRLEHDNSGKPWQVEKVVLVRRIDDTHLVFTINKWLTLERPGFDIAVEVAVSGSDWPEIPVREYVVQTQTGDGFGSGTEASVYVNIVGTLGDTGKRFLVHHLEEEEEKKFQSGAMDTFLVRAVDIGRLVQVVIGHDGKGPGSGWFLKNVNVREALDAQDKYIFTCEKWLHDEKDDCQTERILTLDYINKGSKSEKGSPEPAGLVEVMDESPDGRNRTINGENDTGKTDDGGDLESGDGVDNRISDVAKDSVPNIESEEDEKTDDIENSHDKERKVSARSPGMSTEQQKDDNDVNEEKKERSDLQQQKVDDKEDLSKEEEETMKDGGEKDLNDETINGEQSVNKPEGEYNTEPVNELKEEAGDIGARAKTVSREGKVPNLGQFLGKALNLGQFLGKALNLGQFLGKALNQGLFLGKVSNLGQILGKAKIQMLFPGKAQGQGLYLGKANCSPDDKTDE
ncbi:LOXH1-like protein [Mya arenaria]|uniref:LOXH1-like protein n=1 Tax=Mya arenaria TaxID=6604 RepID=A0ABY7FQ11_MYAAR|nr:LOXH1-like protein [Mya arenaria]